jgi:ABC-type transport system involved in multi-copper enzyme maturation permease subunit
MGVYREGYRQYKGEFLPIRSRFLVIITAEFTRLRAGKWTRRLMLLAAIPLIVTVAVLVGKGMVGDKLGSFPIETMLLLKLLRVEMLVMALVGASAGAGVLADDRAGNALSLYLTRPLTTPRYLVGKGLALGLLLSLVYLLPGMLFVIAAAVFSSAIGFTDFLKDLVGVMWGAGLGVALVTAIVMLFSSVGKRSRNIGLAWFGFYFLSQFLAKGAEQAFEKDWTKYLSLADLFDEGMKFAVSPSTNSVVPVLVQVGILALCVVLLWSRMVRRGKEVVSA